MANDRKEFRVERFVSGPGELEVEFANPLLNELKANTSKLRDVSISNREFNRLLERNAAIKEQLAADI